LFSLPWDKREPLKAWFFRTIKEPIISYLYERSIEKYLKELARQEKLTDEIYVTFYDIMVK
jgi:hypothetical protein